MNESILSLPGYNLCEYLLIIQPTQAITEKVTAVKDAFYEKYQAETAKWSRPHITLIKFSQLQMMEGRVINRLKSLSATFRPFLVELSDFGSFPSHTIYINIESQGKLKELVRQLKPAQALLKSKDIKPHFIENAHLTVARKLLPWQYEKGWLEYSQAHFTGRFVAENMVLLRRPEGHKNYQTVQTFSFTGQPQAAKQASLF